MLMFRVNGVIILFRNLLKGGIIIFNSRWSVEDTAISNAKVDIMKFFEQYSDKVFYSRQIEIIFEKRYFHWITNQALRQLHADKKIHGETINLITGGSLNMYWNKVYRYNKTSKKYLKEAVEYYSNPEFTKAIGNHGEMLVGEALFRGGFNCCGVETNSYKDKIWGKTEHNLDFIVEKNNIAYGIEVKNKLAYIDKEEMDIKIEICEYLGIIPIFACRMLPGSWIYELYEKGGYSWIFKYQMYPFGEFTKAKEYKESLMLPVDSPKRIYDGTIQKLNNFHNKVCSLCENE